MGQVLVLAALLITLLAFWPFAKASASTTAPYAGDLIRNTREASATAPAASAIAGFSLNRTLHAIRRSFAAAARPAVQRPAVARLILSPRRLADDGVPGRMTVARSDTIGGAPSLLIRASWTDNGEPEVRGNPFTLVGNRAGLVNATQSEFRGGEVWLTSEADVRDGFSAGMSQTASP